MAISHDYTLICEFARVEVGNKFIIIGLFPTRGIGTPSIPLVMPTLTMFNALQADKPGTYEFAGKLTQLDGTLLAKVDGAIQATQAGPVIMPIPFQNIQLKSFGSHMWSLEIVGQSDPFVTEFQVTQIAPQQQVIIPPNPKRP